MEYAIVFFVSLFALLLVAMFDEQPRSKDLHTHGH